MFKLCYSGSNIVLNVLSKMSFVDKYYPNWPHCFLMLLIAAAHWFSNERRRLPAAFSAALNLIFQGRTLEKQGVLVFTDGNTCCKHFQRWRVQIQYRKQTNRGGMFYFLIQGEHIELWSCTVSYKHKTEDQLSVREVIGSLERGNSVQKLKGELLYF